MELVIVARTFDSLKTIADTVRTTLANVVGDVNGVDVLGLDISSEGPDEYDPTIKEFSQVWTYTVMHTE